jgi:hypothetical protein
MKSTKSYFWFSKRHKREVNIKMDLIETQWEAVAWIHLAQIYFHFSPSFSRSGWRWIRYIHDSDLNWLLLLLIIIIKWTWQTGITPFYRTQQNGHFNLLGNLWMSASKTKELVNDTLKLLFALQLLQRKLWCARWRSVQRVAAYRLHLQAVQKLFVIRLGSAPHKALLIRQRLTPAPPQKGPAHCCQINVKASACTWR